MTVGELIKELEKYPEDAEVFRGDHYYEAEDGLQIYGLYDEMFEEPPKFFSVLRSCRSMLPSANSIKKNVVVFE